MANDHISHAQAGEKEFSRAIGQDPEAIAGHKPECVAPPGGQWGEGTLEQRRRAYRQTMGEDVADMYNQIYNMMIDSMVLANAGEAHSAASHGPKPTDREDEHDV